MADISKEVPFDFWYELFTTRINLQESAKLFRINSNLRELALILIRRGRLIGSLVYAFGVNQYGQLGLGESHLFNIPTIIKDLEDKNIIKISIGEKFSLFLSDNNDLYISGEHAIIGKRRDYIDEQGRRAATIRRSIDIPELNNFFREKEKIVDISVGENHGLVLLENGDLYTFGNNYNSQLGRDTDIIPNTVPGLVDYPKDFGKIVKITTGVDTSFGITETGRVFAFGTNDVGQIGIPAEEYVSEPTLHNFFFRRGRVKKIFSGNEHTLYLMENGDVYSTGFGEQGQLGINDQLPDEPMIIQRLKDIGRAVNVFGGFNSSFVLMENEDLYTFGENHYGQLGIAAQSANLDALGAVGVVGLGNRENIFDPTLVQFFRGKSRIIKIVGGFDYTFVLLENGTVYGFGLEESGRFGLGSIRPQKPVEIIIENPGTLRNPPTIERSMAFLTPVEIVTLNDIKDIVTSGGSTLVLSN